MQTSSKIQTSSSIIHQQQDEKHNSQLSEMKLRKCSSQVFTSDGKDDNDFGKFVDNTTHHGISTEKTDESRSQCPKNKPYLNEGQQKSQDVKRQEYFDSLPQQLTSSKTYKTNTCLEKSKKVFWMLSKLSKKLDSKLMVHLSKTTTADKYIRLIYSFIKLYRALVPKNNLSNLSKELLNARRILQWENKYQLVKQFMTEQLSAFEVGYKTLQLSGSLFDFSAFWLHCLSNGSSQIQKLADIIYQWQDDCYFYQCFIQLILSTKKLLTCLAQMKKQNQHDEKIYDFKHHLCVLRQRKDNLQKKINLIRKIQKQNSKQIQSFECIILQTLEQQLESKQKQIQSLIKNFKTHSYEHKKHIKKQMIKNILKVIKYVCDSITSFNNYSRKRFNLNPTLGGILSILSSIISLCLLWLF